MSEQAALDANTAVELGRHLGAILRDSLPDQDMAIGTGLDHVHDRYEMLVTIGGKAFRIVVTPSNDSIA